MSKQQMEIFRRRKPRKPLSEEGKPGRLDPRNKLNDLTGKDWLLLTRSYWETEPSIEDKTAYSHPAPFMVRDVERLIKLFTKRGMTVLDPFVGSGTTVLFQPVKPLFPFGYPYAYKINHPHQNIITFRKPDRAGGTAGRNGR